MPAYQSDGGGEPARGEALFLAQAVRSAGRLLPGGPRRLGRCRSDKAATSLTGTAAWVALGGTSGAAPLWAALVALADAWPACSAHLVGFLNPSLYLIAGAKSSSSALNDVTHGNNDLFAGDRYPATVGYDLASGLGTPDAANPLGQGLVTQLCALPESGGAPDASPTTSSVTVLRPAVKANGTAILDRQGRAPDRPRCSGRRQAGDARGDRNDDKDHTGVWAD